MRQFPGRQLLLVVAVNILLTSVALGGLELYFRAHARYSGEPFIGAGNRPT